MCECHYRSFPPLPGGGMVHHQQHHHHHHLQHHHDHIAHRLHPPPPQPPPWYLPPEPPTYHQHHHQHRIHPQSHCRGNPIADMVVMSSSSRQMRNQAEKQRRDKLTGFINELGRLVPMVAGTAKKLDKTSTLRLSATFLRMHQVLVNGRGDMNLIPNLPMTMNWCQYMLEGMDGMLLVVTATGKIVFISHSVESFLGHQQIELLGQSLFNITNIEDHEELRANLRPDEEPSQEGEEGTSRGRTRRRGTDDGMMKPQRRSFYVRLRQRAASRSDQPQYELAHVLGHLRVPSPPSDRKHRADAQVSSDVVLVALVKPFREKHINEYSLLEATKEEWITRHLVDGRIVFTDHRISVVSGYLSEEVTGIHAFRYMHKDDVRWVMIALRQMYYRGESYGCSCYRLQTKTGDFIYIRTHGYLEQTEDANAIQSFICINSLVSKEEGEKYISEMKALFTPLVAQKTDPSVSAIAENHIHLENDESSDKSLSPNVEDPEELKEAIENLMADLPAQINRPSTSRPIDQQQMKAAMLAKTMPPVTVHSSKVGIQVTSLRRKSASMSPSPSTTSPATNYGRPSVLRVTQSDNVSVMEPSLNDQTTSSVLVKQEKGKRVKTEETESSVVVKRFKKPSIDEKEPIPPLAPPPPLPPERVGITGGGIAGGVIKNVHNLKLDGASSSPLETPLKQPTTSCLPGMSMESFDFSPSGVVFQETTTTIIENPQDLPLPSPEYIIPEDFPLPSAAESLDDIHYPSDIIDCFLPEFQNLQERVVRDQIQLADRMQFQDTQLSEIEHNLTSVPIATVGSHIYRNTFTHLKAEHRKQQQILRNLKQDHQNIQHCKDHLNLRGAHQDIGV